MAISYTFCYPIWSHQVYNYKLKTFFFTVLTNLLTYLRRTKVIRREIEKEEEEEEEEK